MKPSRHYLGGQAAFKWALKSDEVECRYRSRGVGIRRVSRRIEKSPRSGCSFVQSVWLRLPGAQENNLGSRAQMYGANLTNEDRNTTAAPNIICLVCEHREFSGTSMFIPCRLSP